MQFLLRIFASEMKLVLVPVLMILLLTQSFSKWIIVMEYGLNRDFISKNLCINKAKPQLHCHGKCQMMKKMAEEEKQNGTKETTKLKFQDLVFIDKLNYWELPSLTFTQLSYNEQQPLLISPAPPTSIFHPPALG